jgi:hypothetical protein
MIGLKERVFFVFDDVVIDDNDVNAIPMLREFNSDDTPRLRRRKE